MFISSVVLRDTLVQLLGIMRGIPLYGALSMDQSGTEAGAQLVGESPKVEISPAPKLFKR